jgi:hypothetical protein
MNRKDIVIVLCTLVLCTLAFDVYLRMFPPKPTPDQVTVVYAIKHIREGNTIGDDDIAETRILKSRLPGLLASFDEAVTQHMGPKTAWYPTSKMDAVGRISKGISGGHILIFKYPGFEGRLAKWPD